MTFSMEAPDLFAGPKPEPGMEKGSEKITARGDSENPEAELPFPEKTSSPEEIAPYHETKSRFENLINAAERSTGWLARGASCRIASGDAAHTAALFGRISGD